MTNKVIVDTSVFIDFFRGKEVTAFRELLLNDRILLSHYVRLELLQGVRKEEVKKLDYVLDGLARCPFDEKCFAEAERILRQTKGSGLTLGIVDLLLAAQSNAVDASIYSFDKVFGKLAGQKLVRLFA